LAVVGEVAADDDPDKNPDGIKDKGDVLRNGRDD
jgi:hypothetical protein